MADARCDGLAVGQRRDPVPAARGYEGRAVDAAESLPHVVVPPGFELEHRSPLTRTVDACAEQGDEGGVVRMLGQPLGREPRVEQNRRSLAWTELVQWVRGASAAARRSAQECEALHPRGCRHGELLRHHAAEADAADAEPLPADVVGEGQGVERVVSHRRRLFGNRRLAQPALVVRQQLEARTEGRQQRVDALQGGARAVDEQQAGPLPAVLVVDGDAPERRGRQAHSIGNAERVATSHPRT